MLKYWLTVGGHYSGSEDSVLGGSARSLLGDPEHSQPQCPHPCAALSCPSRSIKAHLQELGKGNLILKEDKLCIQFPFLRLLLEELMCYLR